ncbi:MAG: DNA primase [Calditrichia bacterium]|nr:DNA primase [Calditrichia bacterium]
MLAKEAGIQLDFKPDSHKDERAQLLQINNHAVEFFQKEYEKTDLKIRKYLENRGINSKTILEFKVGYAPDEWEKLTGFLRKKRCDLKLAEKLGLLSISRLNKFIDRFRGRIMFPIIDLSGNILGFGGRILKAEEKSAKYINSPESLIYKKSEILFGLFHSRETIREKNNAIFTEGYLDVLQLYQNGIKNVVATSGTAFTEKQARLIKRFTSNIDLCFDSDKAGLNAIMKAGLLILNYDFEVKVILLPGGEDPDSFVLKNGTDAFYQQQEKALPFNKFFIHYFSLNYDMKNFSSRQEAIKIAMEMLSGLKNKLLANYLLEELAFIANSPIPSLRKQLEYLWGQKERYTQRKGEKTEQQEVPKPQINIPLPAEERDLIVLLLQGDPSVDGMIMNNIAVDSFSHPDLRKIYEKICTEFDNFGHIDGNKIISNIENKTVLEEITKRMMGEYIDPVQYAEDTINQLQYRNAKIEKDKIALQIKKSEEAGKIDSELIKKLQEALVEMKRLGAILNEKSELN